MALPQFAGGRPCYRPKTKAGFYLLRFASYCSIFEMPPFNKILLLTSFLSFSEVSAIADSADDYRIQAEQGDAKAQAFLGYSFASGEGVPKDEVEAVMWSRKAAEQGDPMAQSLLGNSYAKGKGVPKDMVEAVKWYRKAAEQGIPMAQTFLGNCYDFVGGVPKDMVEAVKWYRKAAEQGYPMAQVFLGNCYASGEGVPKDMVEAVMGYHKAAEQGHPMAQTKLGSCYRFGEGVPMDVVEAVKWYRKAAELGYPMAQVFLGDCYGDTVLSAPVPMEGPGGGDVLLFPSVPKDMVEAVKWYRKAAEQGDPIAQSSLGDCYASGEGVPKDMVEAEKWYRKSAEQGFNYSAQFERAEGVTWKFSPPPPNSPEKSEFPIPESQPPLRQD